MTSTPQAAESSAKKLSGSIGNFTLVTLEGCRAATVLRACWMLRAFIATMNRAVPSCTSIETFTI